MVVQIMALFIFRDDYSCIPNNNYIVQIYAKLTRVNNDRVSVIFRYTLLRVGVPKIYVRKRDKNICSPARMR